MPSKLRLKAFVAVLAILGVAGFFIAREKRPVGEPAAPPATPISAPAPGLKSLAPALQAEVNAFRQAAPVARVERFYEAESRRVGEIDENPDLTAQRLAAMAAELNPGEIDWLKNAALDPKRPGDGRFFAAYLLAQTPGPSAIGALTDIATSPLPNLKNRGLQELERQVRAQAGEGLAHKRGEPKAQDGLLDMAEKQSDPFLQDRAHRGLYEWNTGKRIEEQDEEALKKVMEKKSKR